MQVVIAPDPSHGMIVRETSGTPWRTGLTWNLLLVGLRAAVDPVGVGSGCVNDCISSICWSLGLLDTSLTVSLWLVTFQMYHDVYISLFTYSSAARIIIILVYCITWPCITMVHHIHGLAIPQLVGYIDIPFLAYIARFADFTIGVSSVGFMKEMPLKLAKSSLKIGLLIGLQLGMSCRHLRSQTSSSRGVRSMQCK